MSTNMGLDWIPDGMSRSRIGRFFRPHLGASASDGSTDDALDVDGLADDCLVMIAS